MEGLRALLVARANDPFGTKEANAVVRECMFTGARIALSQVPCPDYAHMDSTCIEQEDDKPCRRCALMEEIK